VKAAGRKPRRFFFGKDWRLRLIPRAGFGSLYSARLGSF
jgi:hypothetical protein